MKLHQLQALVACAETNGIRAAARYLGLSQAAVTRALRELEETHKTSLLIRSPSGLRFTDTGLTLLAHARAILGRIERAESSMAQMRAESGIVLRVGASPWVVRPFLAEAAALFLVRRPDVRLELCEAAMTLTQPLLRDGVADVVIGCVPVQDSAGNDFFTEMLLQFETAILVRKGHSLENARSINSLRDMHWVLNYSPDAREKVLDHVFGRFGLTAPEQRIVVAQTYSMIEAMIGAGMCTWGPKMLTVLPAAGFRIVSVPTAESFPPMTIGIMGRHGNPVASAASELVGCLKEVVAQSLDAMRESRPDLASAIRLL